MRIRNREIELRRKFNKNKLRSEESTYHYSSKDKEKAFISAQFTTTEQIRRYRKYRQEWHKRADKMSAGSFPLAVICELVSLCNLKCKMCYTRTVEFQRSVVGAQRIMPWEVVTRVIDECSKLGVYSMLFSWRGESALYKSKGADGVWHDFADVLSYARKAGILEVTSLTNGRSLSDTLIKKIVVAEPNWISFSIDGLGQAYKKIRASIVSEGERDPFKIVLGNIIKLIRLRDKMGFKRPQIRTNTVYPPISKDPEKYRVFMEKNGIGLVTVNELLDFRGTEIPEKDVMDDWFCMYPFQRLVISANGIILPCPGAHNEDEQLILGRFPGSYNSRRFAGKRDKFLKYPEITLKEAWNSEKIERIRLLHASNLRKEILVCKHCRHGALKHGVKWVPPDWNLKSMEWSSRRWRNG